MMDFKDRPPFGATKIPGKLETDNPLVEAAVAGFFVLAGWGLMKLLSNSEAKINEIRWGGDQTTFRKRE